MCGIAGFSGDFPESLLEGMNASIAHRGPDGDGHVLLRSACPTPVGLAHRRLSIIDLSERGRQPMSVRCPLCGDGPSDLSLVYNGEVYNFAELRDELSAAGHVFGSDTDSEVLLHLYASRGPAMLGLLNGIFAFALYDGRERGRPDGVARGDLLLARDPLGVKPLYYSETARGLLFASELKAILRSPDVSREIDPVALHHTLAYLWTPAPATMLQSVRKLRPGHAMVVRGGRPAREWQYYDLPYGRPPLEGSEEEIARDLGDAVERAVRRQMVADVPVGAFLSGGLDSSAVVAMMRRARPDHEPVCYSIGFAGDADVDGTVADLPYARRVAAHLGATLREIVIEPAVIADRLGELLYHLDEPQADPAPINALIIAEQARRDGIPVLLSGAGGDDIFSGYRRHYALRLERYWRWLPGYVRAGLARPSRQAGRALGAAHRPLVRRLSRIFANADLQGDARMTSYFWWSDDALRRTLYAPALAERLRGVDTAAPLLESLGGIPGETDPLNRMLYLEAKHFLADHNLNYTDKTGMACGVEVRVPLLDLELVDFATRIPPAMKQRGRVGKAIFKKAMEGVLPRDVIYRPKTGFGAPLRRWLRVELRERLEDALSAEAIARRGLFDPAAVRALIDADRAGHVDASYTLFALMTFELWCRTFVDGLPPG